MFKVVPRNPEPRIVSAPPGPTIAPSRLASCADEVIGWPTSVLSTAEIVAAVSAGKFGFDASSAEVRSVKPNLIELQRQARVAQIGPRLRRRIVSADDIPQRFVVALPEGIEGLAARVIEHVAVGQQMHSRKQRQRLLRVGAVVGPHSGLPVESLGLHRRWFRIGSAPADTPASAAWSRRSPRIRCRWSDSRATDTIAPNSYCRSATN